MKLQGPTEERAFTSVDGFSFMGPFICFLAFTSVVNFKHGGGQNNFCLPARELIPISQFQNEGTSVECSTLVLLQIQLAILCVLS